MKEKCSRCEEREAEDWHKCPYSYEMDGCVDIEDEQLCNCCTACTNQCAMDI